MGGTRVESFSYKPSSFSCINHYGNYSFGQVLLSYEKARRHVKESQTFHSKARSQNTTGVRVATCYVVLTIIA